jgi:hypothetical protein
MKCQLDPRQKLSDNLKKEEAAFQQKWKSKGSECFRTKLKQCSSRTKKVKLRLSFFLISFHCIKQLKKICFGTISPWVQNEMLKSIHFVNEQDMDTQKCAIPSDKHSNQQLAFRFLVEIETFPQRCLQFTSLNCFLTLLFLSSSFFFTLTHSLSLQSTLQFSSISPYYDVERKVLRFLRVD